MRYVHVGRAEITDRWSRPTRWNRAADKEKNQKKVGPYTYGHVRVGTYSAGMCGVDDVLGHVCVRIMSVKIYNLNLLI